MLARTVGEADEGCDSAVVDLPKVKGRDVVWRESFGFLFAGGRMDSMLFMLDVDEVAGGKVEGASEGEAASRE